MTYLNMKLLKTIRETDVFPESVHLQNINYKERFAARAVVFDKDKNVALLHVSKHNYYKLPGGGMEKGEDIAEALKRECLEEIGCNVEVTHEIGEILEYRDQHSLKQVSYCFIANVVGEKGKPHFEQGEIDEGFQGVWVSLEEAIQLLVQSKSNVYNGNFIVMRDLTLLQACYSVVFPSNSSPKSDSPSAFVLWITPSR